MYIIANREFPKLFTENRVQTVTHVTWNGPEAGSDRNRSAVRPQYCHIPTILGSTISHFKYFLHI